MKIIGLTGPSGAGKGFCYNFFAKYDVPCIDTDEVYHKLLIPPSECVNELVEKFGAEILGDNQTLNRKKLAEIVFSDESRQKLEALNQITHKYVLKKTHELIADYDKQSKIAVIVDAPLLFEANFDEFCDFTIAVIADKEIRINRIIDRDGISHDAAVMRIKAQNNDGFYTARADYTVTNNGDLIGLDNQLCSVFKQENLIL